MARIDQYLIHCFETMIDEWELGESRSFLGRRQTESVLPMLVHLSDPAVTISDVPDCRVSSRIGDIVACTGSIRTIEALQRDQRVVSIEASRPSSGSDCSLSVPFVHANGIHNNAFGPEKGDRALIAVIDGGIDVLHEAFRNKEDRTRIVALWDQNDPTGPLPTDRQGGHLYGTLHTEADIDRYIANGVVPPLLGRDLPEGHGTHVTSIAGGQATTNFFGGVAPEAKILVVIPRLKVNPFDTTSIAYSASHVDALSYIAGEADRLELPVVVNVSQGMNAGAHDGTSLLEAAFDNFSGGGRLPGRVIVKSAGNERGFDGHAKAVMASNGSECFKWIGPQPHSGPDVVELWFRACDELAFRLVDPSQETSPWVKADESQVDIFGSGNKYSISYDKFHWDNGDSRVLVTVTRGHRGWIEPGQWILEIASSLVRSDGTVHAWLERGRKRPIRFTNNLSEEITLSIPGTARTVVTVASIAAAIPFRVATDSSHGPTRDLREKPDLAAPGESISAAEAGTSANVISKSGTSMAAPHVTGAIALLFSRQQKRMQSDASLRQFNGAQIRAALGLTSQNFNGRSTPSMGYGVLDVQSFLNIFN